MSELPIIPSRKIEPRNKARAAAARTLWATALAHELRNPLNAMDMNLSLVQEALRTAGREDLESLVAATRDQVDSMASILEDFLLYAQPPKPKLKPNDLNQLIRDLVEFLQADFARLGIEFHLLLHSELPPVMMDIHQIRSVILNILGNARKVMQSGGVVSIATFSSAREVCMTIENTGPQIPTELLPRLFQPFVSGLGGSGLGLAIARRIIHEHRGSIGAHNRSNGGPIFTICLPKAK